ncbi:MAG: hypothetical protein E4G98_05905, partial [Promethearchaeota archaeon]
MFMTETYENVVLINEDIEGLQQLEKLFGVPIPQIDQISWIDYKIDEVTHQVEQFRQHYFGFIAKDQRIIALGLSFNSVNEKRIQIPNQIPFLSKFTALETLDVNGWKKVFEKYHDEYNKRQQNFQQSQHVFYKSVEERRKAQDAARHATLQPINAVSHIDLIRQLKELTNLRYLDVSECLLNSLSGLNSLNMLEELDISSNNLANVDDILFEKIQRLDLSSNPIKIFPAGLQKSTGLKILDLTETKIQELPEYLGELQNLEVLNLPLQIGGFPQTFIHLKRLKTLVTHDFPENFAQLTNLETLVISSGTMEALSEGITQLTKLRKLTINNCRFLEKLPEKLGQLQELRELKVTGNGSLESVPASLFQLKKLKTLNFFNNNLKTFDDKLGDLPMLEILTLSNNQLKYIPYSVFKLNNLIDFSIENNPLDLNDTLISAKTLPEIKDYSKKKMAINVFISHAVKDFEPCHLEELSLYLQNQLEVDIAFICERDLSGNIDGFMDKNIPLSQLVIFIGTPTSVKSVDCQYELKLSREYDVQILPIKAKELDWGDLGTIGLSRELGMEVDFTDREKFQEFCHNLYEYIKQLKRQIDLHDKEQGKIDRLTIGLKA